MKELRTAIVYSLEISMNQQEADFKRAVDNVDNTTISCQNPAAAKAMM